MTWPNHNKPDGIHHQGGKKINWLRISYICHERIIANLTVASRGISNELVGAIFIRNESFFPRISVLLARPERFLYGNNWDPTPECWVPWSKAQRSFQNHHQTVHDRCPEKVGPLPKKIDYWLTRTRPENMGPAPSWWVVHQRERENKKKQERRSRRNTLGCLDQYMCNMLRLWNSLGIWAHAEDGDCETVRPMKQSRYSWLSGGFLVMYFQ